MEGINNPEDALLVEYFLGHVRRERRVQRREDLFTLDDRDFFDRFRMTKATARRVIKEINLAPPACRTNAMPPEEKFLIALRYFSSGSFLICMGDFGGIHKSTVSRIIREVSIKIARLAPRYIQMPRQEELQRVAYGFKQVANFPMVAGAIDGCHIGIANPGGNNGETFRNRKGVFSINSQMVVDSSLKIRNVTAHHPGSVHDQTLLDGSWLRTKFELGDYNPCILVGDSGYACSPWLLTPLPNPQTRGQQLFNESLIRTRNCAERSFGVLKRRFPVLNKIRVSLPRSEAIIVACCVLHNICIEEGEQLEQDENDDGDNYDQQEVVPQTAEDQGNCVTRNSFVRYFDMLAFRNNVQ